MAGSRTCAWMVAVRLLLIARETGGGRDISDLSLLRKPKPAIIAVDVYSKRLRHLSQVACQ